MKKFLLVSILIFVFGAYVLKVRFLPSDESSNVVAPNLQTNSGITQPAPTSISTPNPLTKSYKDGTYTGDAADAFYGNIQVQAIISGGKITDVKFLQYPSDRSTSIEINTQAMPYLKQEAIAAQSAQVDIVSGATQSSQAFIQSLGVALAKAQ